MKADFISFIVMVYRLYTVLDAECRLLYLWSSSTFIMKVLYSEEGMGPEAMVFEVVFPPGETPNILLEESQPGNKVSLYISPLQ